MLTVYMQKIPNLGPIFNGTPTYKVINQTFYNNKVGFFQHVLTHWVPKATGNPVSAKSSTNILTLFWLNYGQS